MKPAVALLHEATTLDECHWNDEVPTESALGLGHLGTASIQLVRAACLTARRQANAGQGREALADVFAGLKLAHRVGTGGVFFARALECAGEIPAFATLGRLLPGLDHAALDDLARRLDDLPPPEAASAAVGHESRFILGSIRDALQFVRPSLAEAEWEKLGLKEEASALKRLTGGDRNQLLAHLDATAPGFAELALRLELPRPEGLRAVEAFVVEEQSNQPIVANLAEHAWGARHVVDRMNAMRGMLRAGIALVREGEPAFLAILDPFGTGPFGLERRKTGLVIRSSLHDEGRPEVCLTIKELRCLTH